MEALTPVVRLTIPPHAEHLSLSRELLGSVARTAGLDRDAVADLKVAVSEAVTNAIVHGGGASDASIEVVYQAFPGRVVVDVLNSGPRFELVRDVPLAPSALDPPEHGFGLVLADALADEMEIATRHSGDGCRVRLVKHCTA